MKKLTFVLVALLCMSQAGFAANRSTSMSPIMSKAKELMNYIEDEQNLEIVRMEFDILSSSKSTFRSLSSSYTYTIIAFGDYRFKDIDVKVYRKSGGEWTLVEEDVDTSSVAVVSVKPSYTAEYKIVISAYKFNDGYDVGHYGLFICHE